MTGAQEATQLRAAGFTEDEITEWSTSRRNELSDAGFRQDEIDQYFGVPQFNDKPVSDYVNESMKQATAPADGTTKPVTSFMEAIENGLQMSVSGLIARGRGPDTGIPEDAPRMHGIASTMASLAGDSPAMIAGFLLGGGPVTGTAGAFALPAGIRKILMDKYEKGEAASFGDFWDRFSGAFLETAKNWVTGAATGAVGKAVGALPIQNALAKGTAVTGAEVATMVSVGSAMEGKVPEPDDFINAAITLGFIKGSGAVAGKLRRIYAERGITPAQVIEDAKKHPSIHADLSSSNKAMPSVYDVMIRQEALPVKAQDKPSTTATPPMPGALGKISDYISTTPQQERALTWQDLYTKAVDDLNPIREAVKKAEKIGGLDRIEKVDGEIVDKADISPSTLRPRPLLAGDTPLAIDGPKGGPRTLLAGDTPLAIEGPKGGWLEEVKRDGGPLSTEFIRTRTNSPTGKLADATELADPYKLMRLQRGSMGKATHFLEHGTVDFKTLATNGESLAEIMKPVKEMDGFRNFIVSRRAVELHGRGIESGIPPDLAKQAVAEGTKKFGREADRLVEYQNRVTKYLRDSGIISSEQYDAMLEANKFYVPFFRLLGSDGGRGDGITVRNPIKAIEGSDKMILDPLESVIKNTYIYTALAERNAAGAAFIKMADKTGNPDLFYKKIPPDTMKIELTEPEIRRLFKEFVETVETHKTTSQTSSKTTRGKSGRTEATSETETKAAQPDSKGVTLVKNRVMEALKSRGFSDGEATQMIERLMTKEAPATGRTTAAKETIKETITEKVERVVTQVEKTVYEPELNIRLPSKAAEIFRAIREPLRPNEIAVFENGKRNVYSLDRDTAAAFKSLDAETANLFVKIIAIPAKTLRAGAILSPDFMARNAIRDQLTAGLLSKSGYYPVFDFVRGAMSLIKKDEHFGNWLKAGGANSAMVSVDRQYLKEHLFNLSKETGLMERGWNVVKSPLEGLRVASELIENATRLGEFKRAARGATDKQSLQEAAFSSREVTLDFARIGANMRAINMISAFTNVQIQGLDRVIRGFGDNPIGMSAKIGAGITLPSMLLWWANHDDERWPEISRWEKDLFWIVMTKDHVYRIPKPFELGVIFGSLPERAMEKYFTDHPNALADFGESLIGALTPNLTPQIAQPLIEQFSGTSLFTGAPLVPYRMESLLPEYQYTEYTTELAKAIGSLIGAVPGVEYAALKDEQTVIGGTARALSTPILIENYTRAWTGGLGSYALQLADKALRVAGALPSPVKPAWTVADIPVVKAFVVRHPSASAQSIRDFFENYKVAESRFKTFNLLVEQGDARAIGLVEKHADSLVQLSDIRQVLTDSAKLVRMIHDNPDISADEKRQLIDTQYFRMIEMARAGNEITKGLHDALE